MRDLHVSVSSAGSDFIQCKVLRDQLISCLNWLSWMSTYLLGLLSDIPDCIMFISRCDFFVNCQIQAHLQRGVSEGNLCGCVCLQGPWGSKVSWKATLVGLVLFVSNIPSVLRALHASSPVVNITASDSYVSCTGAGIVLSNLHLIFEFI